MLKESSRLELIRDDEQPKFPDRKKYAARLRELGYEENAQAFEKAIEIAEAMKAAGGRALFVGGSVRDTITGYIPKDFDLEVYGLEARDIKKILLSLGEISETGKQFAILKLKVLPGFDVDVSMPRKDSKIGQGHGKFDVETDPNMSIEEAARRRDFTMNSLAADPFTGEIYDYFGGIEDIRNRVLRATDKKLFKDDALRVLRAVQFVGRFGLQVEPETLRLIQETIPDMKFLSKKRFLEEWKKMLLKSEKPSMALTVGMVLGVWPENNPELVLLTQTPQEPEWHPEGDAWIHTLMVVDEAAKIIRRQQLPDDEALIIMLAALCHDLGKPGTTETNDKGRIISYGHEKAGEEPTINLLAQIGVPEAMKQKIVKLVTEHLTPSLWYVNQTVRGQNITKGAINRLAERLHPATIQELVLVCEADHLGRGSFEAQALKEQLILKPEVYEPGAWLLERARECEVEASKPPHLTTGKDWAMMGFKQGIHIGKLIRLSDELRDDKDYTKADVMRVVIDCKVPEEAIVMLEQELKN